MVVFLTIVRRGRFARSIKASVPGVSDTAPQRSPLCPGRPFRCIPRVSPFQLLMAPSPNDVKLHHSQDLVVIRLATAGEPASGKAPERGVTIKESAESDLLGVPTAAVKTYEQVAVGNDVILYGYPGSPGIRNNPQLDPSRPLLRRPRRGSRPEKPLDNRRRWGPRKRRMPGFRDRS
jgi:hypothetical protein